MSTTTPHPTAATVVDDAAPTRRRVVFPLLGGLAGVTAFVGQAILWSFIDGPVKAQGAEAVVDFLATNRISMHIATSLTWVAVAALVGFAVGYTRFLADRLGGDNTFLAAVRLGLTSAVGALIVTTSMKALTVGGLPGAIDAAMYDSQDVATLFILTDQMQWVGWMGVVIAMAATALATVRHRVLPRWFAVFTGGVTVLVAAMTLVLGLPYSAGLAAPLWLVVSTVVLLRAARRAV